MSSPLSTHARIAYVLVHTRTTTILISINHDSVIIINSTTIAINSISIAAAPTATTIPTNQQCQLSPTILIDGHIEYHSIIPIVSF